ncbi:nuclear transport factor 2 family protein [Phycicoccus sp. BSK3Z-2]|uniref:Nuclear transport factor 2 family protein n=1 Tax=Phycicoccus avicenniae TaxID=2828860 RepID=A0A941I156_9MICO|nr:nuclear transport factor 2 family protein [Phycicoccus avicenniae]MBR7743462.1 nuclear transport factor 2 family protein [Phycicoccus avicenniae]MBR7743946.1 nuclear transport factor 2 family protein [Phycicoccus avicenniae]
MPSSVTTPTTATRPATPGPGPMTEERLFMTEERLLAFFDACSAGDPDAIAAFFTADAVYLGSRGPADDGVVFEGREAVRAGMAAFLGGYADASYRDVDVRVGGSWGLATWTFHGTPHGGVPSSYRGVDVLAFEGDLIRRKDAFRKERSEPAGGDGSGSVGGDGSGPGVRPR